MSQEDQNLPVLQAMQGGVLTSSHYEYMFWVDGLAAGALAGMTRP